MADVGHGEGQVRLRGGADTEFGHAADDTRQTRCFGDGEDARRRPEAACLGDVDVEHVHRFGFDTGHGVGGRPHRLVSHDSRVDGFPQEAQSLQVVFVQGLLDELDVELFQLTDVEGRSLRIRPAHVGVDAQAQVWKAPAQGRQVGNVGLGVTSHLHLQRSVALIDQGVRLGEHLVDSAHR